MLNTDEYDGARMRVVEVSITLLDDLFTAGREFRRMAITAGLPEGARFVAVDYDAQRGIVQFVYVHASFDPIPAGAWVPVQDVTVMGYYDPPVATESH